MIALVAPDLIQGASNRFANILKISIMVMEAQTKCGQRSGIVMLRSCATGQCTGTLAGDEGHEDALNSARMSQDGTSLLTSSADRTAKLWDLKTGKCARTFPDMTLRILGFRSEIFWEKATLASRGMILYGHANHDLAHSDCPLVI